MEKNIKQIFYLVSSKYLITKFINWAEFKNAIKTEVSHYVYKEIKRSPIIIPVLISTDIDAINLTKTNTQKEN
jgi:ribonuclease J